MIFCGACRSLPREDRYHVLYPDYLLHVDVRGDPSLSGQYPVNDAGCVNLGYLGAVSVENMTPKESARRIEWLLKQAGLPRAGVTVTVVRASFDSVKVTGAVVHPQVLHIKTHAEISLR